MEEKTGLFKLGFVKNLKTNDKGQNCSSVLSRFIGREIQLAEINTFVDSDDFRIDYIDNEGNITDKETSSELRFKLPWIDVQGNVIFGCFTKNGSNFVGVIWRNDIGINRRRYGKIDPTCWEKLKSICGKEITESTIRNYITSSIDYYNGAGYAKFPDGTVVTFETGKFIKFDTNLFVNGERLVGWFTKNLRGRFEGISWGDGKGF